jgi:hypothetical protein
MGKNVFPGQKAADGEAVITNRQPAGDHAAQGFCTFSTGFSTALCQQGKPPKMPELGGRGQSLPPVRAFADRRDIFHSQLWSKP